MTNAPQNHHAHRRGGGKPISCCPATHHTTTIICRSFLLIYFLKIHIRRKIATKRFTWRTIHNTDVSHLSFPPFSLRFIFPTCDTADPVRSNCPAQRENGVDLPLGVVQRQGQIIETGVAIMQNLRPGRPLAARGGPLAMLINENLAVYSATRVPT